MILTTVDEISEAVAVHVKPDGLGLSSIQTYWDSPVEPRHFVIDCGGFFDITDPRHWMMVVEAMRAERLFLTWEDRPIYSDGGAIHTQAHFGKLGKNLGVARNAEPGIAIGIAALRAKGIDCEWRPKL